MDAEGSIRRKTYALHLLDNAIKTGNLKILIDTVHRNCILIKGKNQLDDNSSGINCNCTDNKKTMKCGQSMTLAQSRGNQVTKSPRHIVTHTVILQKRDYI